MSRATSAHLGAQRIAYLDALAALHSLPSRAAALVSIWPRSAVTGALIAPHRRPDRTPIPLRLRSLPADGVPVCQLGGASWGSVQHEVAAMAAGPGAPAVSKLCRDVIDAHADVHAAAVLG